MMSCPFWCLYSSAAGMAPHSASPRPPGSPQSSHRLGRGPQPHSHSLAACSPAPGARVVASPAPPGSCLRPAVMAPITDEDTRAQTGVLPPQHSVPLAATLFGAPPPYLFPLRVGNQAMGQNQELPARGRCVGLSWAQSPGCMGHPPRPASAWSVGSLRALPGLPWPPARVDPYCSASGRQGPAWDCPWLGAGVPCAQAPEAGA